METNCDACSNKILPSETAYENGDGKILCVHCWTELYKKNVRMKNTSNEALEYFVNWGYTRCPECNKNGESIQDPLFGPGVICPDHGLKMFGELTKEGLEP
jgi:DNA-directed RNA polymerase subunit RPC12/RpoP